jgi:putative radical SAM enzyme (TIGR03279 family)
MSRDKLKHPGLAIRDVEPGSIAADLGWSAEDRVLAVNGQPVRDPLDYRFLVAEELVTIELQRLDGERISFEIEKDPDDSLGTGFAPIEPDRCGNQCTFCFVHQMPRGLRRSLYIKDEDYRLSFLAGHFTTLATIADAEIERIVRQRLSPQYVSVHATEESLRRRLLGNPASRPVLPTLDALIHGGVRLHTQIVLIPGENDGAALDRSLSDLLERWPGIQSVAVVPVGLTQFRKKLPSLASWTRRLALPVLDQVKSWQERCRHATGSSFAYAADEFYLLAGRRVPRAREYDGFPQLGNGVGMVRRFLDGVDRLQRRKGRICPRPLRGHLVTGRAAAPVVARLARLANRHSGVSLSVLPVDNRLFGGGVSCSGLLTGRDILEQTALAPPGDLILPDLLLGETEATRHLLLDDVSLDELARRSGRSVVTVPHEAEPAWTAICAWSRQTRGARPSGSTVPEGICEAAVSHGPVP